MTSNEKQLILDLSLNLISKEIFLSKFPRDFVENKYFVIDLLEKSYLEKNSDDVEYALLLGFIFDSFNINYADILCKLVIEDWHYKHEDIILILQDLKSPKCVDAIYQTAFKRFDYLNYDDTHSLGRKCIHALADINTIEAWDKLNLIAQSDIPILKEQAKKQIGLYKD